MTPIWTPFDTQHTQRKCLEEKLSVPTIDRRKWRYILYMKRKKEVVTPFLRSRQRRSTGRGGERMDNEERRLEGGFKCVGNEQALRGRRRPSLFSKKRRADATQNANRQRPSLLWIQQLAKRCRRHQDNLGR